MQVALARPGADHHVPDADKIASVLHVPVDPEVAVHHQDETTATNDQSLRVRCASSIGFQRAEEAKCRLADPEVAFAVRDRRITDDDAEPAMGTKVGRGVATLEPVLLQHIDSEHLRRGYAGALL